MNTKTSIDNGKAKFRSCGHKKVIATMLAALLIGAAGGYWFALGKSQDAASAPAAGERKPVFYRNPMNPAITSPVPAKDEMGMDYIPVYAEDAAPQEKKPLFYRNPMNPAITSPVPAKDEMGMDYIPVYADEETAAQPGTVKIDPTTVQNIGVRTAEAKRAALSRAIRTVGRVTYDEQRVLRLHPKYDGWVEKLFVDKTGDWVKKGDKLLSIYAPQLVATQQEYLLALENAEKLKDSPFADVREGAQSLLRSTRERLQLLDVPEHQITELAASRRVIKGVHIHSPLSGVVMNIGAREGEHVMPDKELYMIADLKHVWVMVDLYENEMPWVREGDAASMQVAAIPGRTFKGRLTRIYPYLDAKTRTVKARLEFDNADLALKPDMFGNVTVHADRQVDAVTVPSEAIVRTGAQEQVFVQRAPGHFEPRNVVTGVAADGQTQIVSGLEAGEIVVTSSQFLIDSESKLKEATAKMLDAAQGGAVATQPENDVAQHDMSQHDMSQHNEPQPVAPQHDHGGAQ